MDITTLNEPLRTIAAALEDFSLTPRRVFDVNGYYTIYYPLNGYNLDIFIKKGDPKVVSVEMEEKQSASVVLNEEFSLKEKIGDVTTNVVKAVLKGVQLSITAFLE